MPTYLAHFTGIHRLLIQHHPLVLALAEIEYIIKQVHHMIRGVEYRVAPAIDMRESCSDVIGD
jgi:hypothetical protein